MVVLLGTATLGAASADGPTGSVRVIVSMEAVGITITGGELDLGGPHTPGDQLYVTGTQMPHIKNTGNVAISEMDLVFDGPQGEEALCAGDGTWAADITPDTDQFALRAIVRPEGQGNSQAAVDGATAAFVAPSTGSGNIYAASSDLGPDQVARLVMRLDLPTAVTNGADGCTIDMTLTAYAADE